VFPAFSAAYRLSPRPSRDITPPLSSLVARAIHRESGNPEPDISRRIETRKKIELTLHFTNCAVLFSLSLSLSFSLSLSLSLIGQSCIILLRVIPVAPGQLHFARQGGFQRSTLHNIELKVPFIQESCKWRQFCESGTSLCRFNSQAWSWSCQVAEFTRAVRRCS